MSLAHLGVMHAASLETDPKHVAFTLARYLFVARMVGGRRNVLEVGCGDGTGARIVRPVVSHLVGVDVIRPVDYPGPVSLIDIRVQDVPTSGGWDAVFALDVLEHIEFEHEKAALGNMVRYLNPDGVCIIGMPSLESQPYASAISLRHHVNTKTEDGLRDSMENFFHNVFMFGMNDTTLHAGFGPMCHYRFALCTTKRKLAS